MFLGPTNPLHICAPYTDLKLLEATQYLKGEPYKSFTKTDMTSGIKNIKQHFGLANSKLLDNVEIYHAKEHCLVDTEKQVNKSD